ncbi:MAG: hypothetical protein P1U36_04375 [Legionellaceae bacterium]|nr:hypothetical protein [Legionellaceae bacterium]
MGKDVRSQANLCPPEAVGILESPSYYLLDQKTRDCVKEYSVVGSSKKEEFPDDVKVDLRSAILNRRSLVQALEEGKYFLKTLDPATFYIKANAHETRYDVELSVVKRKLKLLNYLILMSAERAKETRNLPALPEHKAYLERVGRMLAALRDAQKHAKQGTKPTPLEGPKTVGDKDAPLRYFGMLNFVPAVEDMIKEMTLNNVENKHDILASYNGLRLYLVWANALAQSICNVIAQSVQQTLTVTQTILTDLALATGSLGFILYFTTFGISASIVLQNTLSLGLTKKVRALELGWYERFQAQWDERKFLMLNNAVWGLVNFVCFFWLVGQNALGFWGNVLTGVLFIADLFLVWWQSEEAEAEHRARLKFYEQGIEDLNKHIDGLMTKGPEKQMMIAKLQFEKRTLLDLQKQLDLEWRYKKQQHDLNLMYGIAVVIGFAVLCSFFFPPALIVPFTAMILTLTGAVMCFGFGVAHKALSGEIIVQKELETRRMSVNDYLGALESFKAVSEKLKNIPNTSPEHKRIQTESQLLYLSLKKAMATEFYQTQVIDYQRAQIICNVLTDIILPTLFLLAFVFMPLGIGMPIFAIGLATLFYAHWQVAEMAPEDKKPEMFKALDSFVSWIFSKEAPAEKGFEQLNEAEYNDFCARIKKGDEPTVILNEQLEKTMPKAPPELPDGKICPE